MSKSIPIVEPWFIDVCVKLNKKLSFKFFTTINPDKMIDIQNKYKVKFKIIC